MVPALKLTLLRPLIEHCACTVMVGASVTLLGTVSLANTLLMRSWAGLGACRVLVMLTGVSVVSGVLLAKLIKAEAGEAKL